MKMIKEKFQLIVIAIKNYTGFNFANTLLL